MIQDISPALNNQYDAAVVATDDDLVLCFDGSSLMLREETCTLPRVREWAEKPLLTYAFAIGEQRYFLLLSDTKCLPGYVWISLRDLRTRRDVSRTLLFAAYTGIHLAEWYRDHQRCGRCGEKTAHSPKERAMICTGCGRVFYPRIQPAVIVGVIRGEQILLTRYNRGYAHNALIAGFTEIGETLEQTVAREVMEEAGLHVKNIRYYKSQPWGSAGDILAGFYCDAAEDEPLRVDHDELKSAVWTARGEIELQPDDLSLTNEMMKRFKNGEPC